MTVEPTAAASRRERTHRLFFALWPSDDLRRLLAPRIRALQPVGIGRPQRPDQWHLTLEFLGPVAVSRLAAVHDAAAQVRAVPCELRLDAVEHWRRPEVLCLVARELPAALEALVQRLRSELAVRGFDPETRPFRAHLTLARKVRQPIEPGPTEPVTWPVHGFSLVESVTDRSGSVYTPLASWPASA